MIGQRFKTNKFGWIEIIGVESKGAVKIRFDDTKSTRVVPYSVASKGSVRDFYAKTMAGIGYIGEGEHKTCDGSGVNSHAYSSWRGIITRLKDESQICEEWKCFQTFADWFYANVKDGYRISVKTGKGGERYFSPETCSFSHKNAKFVPNVVRNCPRPKIDIMTALRMHGKKIDFGMVASL